MKFGNLWARSDLKALPTTNISFCGNFPIKIDYICSHQFFHAMNVEEFRTYCLSKKGVTESLPFGPDTLVFKVLDKMFALTGLDHSFSFSVKCDPEIAESLRERYHCVQQGYHMNKKMWNTIKVDGSVNDNLLRHWIDHSYEEVVKKMTRKQQEELKGL